MEAETPARHHSTRPPAVGSLMVFDRVLELNGALSKRSESKGCRPDAINRGGTTETAFVPNLDGGGIFFRGVYNVYTPPKIATSPRWSL